MRHAVPAAMNELGASFRNAGGRKVSTDWAVPYERLGEALEISEQAVQKHGAPMPITYGHAGNGHPHQNFIAENPEALRRINAAVDETLQSVIGLGGTVSAEHGLGKLKRHWLSLQSTAKQIDVMKALKASLDPHGILAPGNILCAQHRLLATTQLHSMLIRRSAESKESTGLQHSVMRLSRMRWPRQRTARCADMSRWKSCTA